MKSGASPDQSIADVLESLSQSRALLLDPSPQNIDHCQVMMGQCAERLAEFVQDPDFAARAGDRFIADVHKVRSELASLSGLLNAAAAFRRDMLTAMRNAADSVTPCIAPRITPGVVTAGVIPADASGKKAHRVHILC